MKFTGERFIPNTPGHLTTEYEHMHRYEIAARLTMGLDALDIACGEGYGSRLLAEAARSVTGVDISPEAVAHAQETYPLPNLRFMVGDCAAIPLENNSVDAIVSFETLEHHTRHEEMVGEVRRTLRPEGMLIISSPNKAVYTDLLGNRNEHHVRELYLEEFRELLERNFRYVRLFGQRLCATSLLQAERGHGQQYQRFPCAASAEENFASLSPVYFLAICSDNDLKEAVSQVESLYFNPSQDLYRTMQAAQRGAEQRLSESQRKIEELQGQIKAMEGSSFWKLRNAFHRIKKG